jgi:hypothetical protein
MSLFAVAISMSCVFGFAAAPVIRDLPSVNIGDNENNIGTDNNFFVFTNAFKLDDYISQSGGSPIASLIWSFDEASAIDGDVQWFQINGLDPVLLGNTAIANDQAAGFTAHKTPTNNLRAVSNMASFRDVVLSPVSGAPPFTPTPTDLSNHATGKIVRFYASNGTEVGFKNTVVQSVDGTSDSLSGGGTFFTVTQDDTFTTGDPSSTTVTGWQFSGNTLSTKVYSAANAAIGVSIATSSNLFRSGGWQANAGEWLEYSLVNTASVVRAKYYMYASPTTAGNKNQIPSIRLRLQERFAVTNGLVVSGNIGNPATDAITQELLPSENPALPSLYRVDFVPICTPFMSSSIYEGFQRYWDVYGDQPGFSGTIGMTESVIGMYPRTLIDPSVGTLGKTYTGADFYTYYPSDNSTLVYVTTTTPGAFPTSGTAPLPTIVEKPTGVELDSSLVTGATNVGVPVREFNPPQDTTNFPSLVRADEGQQYVVRWHLTSTKATNRQSHVRLRARSIGFGWSTQLELGGAWISSGPPTSSGGANNQIAQEAHPGVGSLNPDKLVAGENGGWYTQVLPTPISTDIRPDKTGTWQARMPLIALQPLPGANAFGSADRAWRFGMDILDTLSTGDLKALEEGNEFIDRLELRTYTLVPDN